MKILFLLILMIPISAFSQVSTTASAVVETPFWQAPVAKELFLTIEFPNTMLLDKACKNFKIEMNQLKDEGFSRFNQKYIDRLRNKPIVFDGEHSSFEESFLIKSAGEFQVELVGNTNSSKKLLPYFSNLTSIQRLVINGSEKFTFKSQEDSMARIVEMFNLEVEQPYLEVSQNKELILRVKTMDMACDLLDSKIQLQSEVKSEVRLAKDRIKEIENFYQFNLLEKFSNVMKKKISLNQKALLLGYRLSESYQNEINENDRELLETGFLDLMNLIVDPSTLKPSQYLYMADDRYFVNSTLYSTPATVTVKFGLESL
ncbi:MAG: hypothetical protein COW00_11415 [Bdellovibrio sp. CG12_big_fil_rev_8_21_14_0_65_39_13]|nr:MAG: hypothetical protein COW78_04905 [Bdellovibrio sp. CG22_combo_CG10-13_8_21_14_all_39_27]PIQ59330.1 MAG: hypothetical protein COW00_11415 [Bdellovibrio sp. CG12_big_fil_rev_8_21_14_0_65_39_13]PIR32341.1 MAG: hypothetical protein COV37_20710 [Bdellovibrio sp. CG11_big_fil_rev_8_21_14_0_20_39_38]PJB53058.1 MAG: hypothetical protein CO099_09180 [Bdellovibrio sp. CG_4_9_14_3_um_filter_39_7]